MNKHLKENFKELDRAWNKLTNNVSDYSSRKDLQNYYNKLLDFQDEVNYKMGLIKGVIVVSK